MGTFVYNFSVATRGSPFTTRVLLRESLNSISLLPILFAADDPSAFLSPEALTTSIVTGWLEYLLPSIVIVAAEIVNLPVVLACRIYV
ncbi:hypothetical protein SDC9_210061 [bioreactor metagenome]|uniref:Uncharacterized protein n=1 Tax=bioreactor metagenome TaxID=1076179 RepID=A0A645JPX4_9ZZZZ